MTLAPFAALQERLNRTVQSRLANAIASYQGGGPFGVILDSASAGELYGGTVNAATRTCGFDCAHAPGIAEGQMLVIDGATYRISGGTVPDETGWLQLQVYPEVA